MLFINEENLYTDQNDIKVCFVQNIWAITTYNYKEIHAANIKKFPLVYI